ncbi:MAG: MarR family transcriptional regulator [Chloroflexi bacterium AL-W]|nr:MarR family transcriptional regulator [Chloroflexi bacterium AL-N1]NOK68000.1 MarR family transcriptional regulator [Chloroflexi bacterium AL-N10]NOK73340.1 MarR family transcriptional regulator [Chloroflexi bacterium AL-N5]NOK83254.1 MarR family transcriptional regulator [Chloroflexi bacterium AL-W]NOK87671.1 MarR family transcriptional regulator [Chloroflexi bacterium AL-N15]
MMDLKKDLEKQVLLAARETNTSSVLFRNAIRSKLGLNITDSECLSFLSIKGASTPKDISHYTGLTTGSTTAMLDRLEKAEFIRRRPNPHDRRGALIEINEKWTETVGPIVMGVQKAQAKLIASYSDKELEIIVDFLTRFANNVKEYTEILEEDLP